MSSFTEWKRKKSYVIAGMAFLAISASLLVTGCSTNPATGHTNLNLVTEEQEKQIGEESDPVIRQEYGVYKDYDLTRYVNEVGQRLVAISDRPNLPFYFTVLDSPMINAFALPGGYIYVTRGILAQMNSEAELAFVLGHEISHVTARHGAQRISQIQAAQLLNLGAGALFGREKVASWSPWVNAGVSLAVLGYGRENEFEADLIGTDYAAEANYDPETASNFLYTLKRQEQYEPNWLQTFLSSHPPTSERIDRVEDKTTQIIADAPDNYEINKRRYLLALRGLAMGSASASGNIQQGLYSNGQYQFKMYVPPSWLFTTIDQRAVLRFLSPDQSVAGTVISKYFPTANPGMKALTDYVSTLGLPISNYVSQIRTDRTDTRHTFSDGGNNNIHEVYAVMSEQYGYLIHVEATPAGRQTHGGTIARIFDSFRRMTPAEANDYQLYRLRIHMVETGQSFADLSRTYFGNDNSADKIAAFNGYSPGEEPVVGEYVKIPPPF